MKTTGITLIGIAAIALLTYAYFDWIFASLSKGSLFDEEGIKNYL